MSNKLNRKDLLLLLLFSPGSSGEEAEPIDGRTRLMKLLFLLQFQVDFPVDKILESKSKYEFQPYHYGPFTKDVYNDLEFLENVGLIEFYTKGIAGEADQNEEEKLVEDIVIGEDKEDINLEFKEEGYRLTPAGSTFVTEKLIPTAPEDLLRVIRELKGKFASLPLVSLLRYVYSKYPDYAQKSMLTYLISS